MRALRYLAVLVACLAMPPVATADPVLDAIVGELKTLGYERIEISRTFLGRHRIVATTSDSGRELIINGGTGSVVRDRRFDVISSDNDWEDDNENEPLNWEDNGWQLDEGAEETWTEEGDFYEDGDQFDLSDDDIIYEEADDDFFDADEGESW